MLEGIISLIVIAIVIAVKDGKPGLLLGIVGLFLLGALYSCGAN